MEKRYAIEADWVAIRKALQTQNKGSKGFILILLKMAFYCATKRAYKARPTMRLSKLNQHQRIANNFPKSKNSGKKQ